MTDLKWKNVFLSFLLLETVYQSVVGCKHEFSSRFGKISYKADYSWQKCDWKFTYNGSSSDVVFGIKFQERYWLGSGESVTLPDEAVLSGRFSYSPWCGLYVKESVRQQALCREGVKYPIICDKATVYSKSWPPKITTYLYYYNMELVYGFFDCTNITTTTTTTTTTAAKATTRTTTTKTATTTKTSTATTTATTRKNGVETTTTAVSTGVLSSEVTRPDTSQRNNLKFAAQEEIALNMTVTTGILAALLLISVCALVAAFIKHRNLSNQPTTNGNNVNAMVAGPSQATYSTAYGEREMVDNELYATSNAGEKQTVYNELYTA